MQLIIVGNGHDETITEWVDLACGNSVFKNTSLWTWKNNCLYGKGSGGTFSQTNKNIFTTDGDWSVEFIVKYVSTNITWLLHQRSGSWLNGEPANWSQNPPFWQTAQFSNIGFNCFITATLSDGEIHNLFNNKRYFPLRISATFNLSKNETVIYVDGVEYARHNMTMNRVKRPLGIFGNSLFNSR